MRKVESKELAVIIKELKNWLPYINTITADNGKEFAGHKQVAEELSIGYSCFVTTLKSINITV